MTYRAGSTDEGPARVLHGANLPRHGRGLPLTPNSLLLCNSQQPPCMLAATCCHSTQPFKLYNVLGNLSANHFVRCNPCICLSTTLVNSSFGPLLGEPPAFSGALLGPSWRGSIKKRGASISDAPRGPQKSPLGPLLDRSWIALELLGPTWSSLGAVFCPLGAVLRPRKASENKKARMHNSLFFFRF